MRKLKPPQISARRILELLAEKHLFDVFVPECKDGPTQAGSHRRLDAWAMNRSWANATATGYEIKVSRSDFLGDTKWTDYLGLCNCFYWVCPRGLIDVAEVPDGTGLMYVATTGTRLFTKRKAPWRNVEIPESLFRYILMCRTRVKDERISSQSNAENWRLWLAKKREKQQIGYEVQGRIRELYDEVKRENTKLKQSMMAYDAVRARLEELGFDPDCAVSTWRVTNRLDEVLGQITPNLIAQLGHTISRLEKLRQMLGGETGKSN